MSTAPQAEPDASPTQTPTEAPKAAKVATVADFNAGSVFDGEVAQTHNERNRAATRDSKGGGDDAPPTKRKRGGKASAPPPPPDPEQQQKYLQMAFGLVSTADALFVQVVKARYADALDPTSIDALGRQMALDDASKSALAQPLAVGLAENGVEMPWWAQLALAGVGVYAGRMGALAKLDKVISEKQQAQGPTITVTTEKR